MTYTRVIPRDLYNESKLLKCLGQVSLLLHEGTGIRWPLEVMHLDAESDRFLIEQRDSDGGLYCSNLVLVLNGERITLYSAYNSKAAYPLYFESADGDESGSVLNDDGSLAGEFTRWLDCVTKGVLNGERN